MPMKSFGHSIFKLRVAQLSAAAVVVVLVIVAASPVVTSAAADASRLAEGAGQTIIEGGTGGTSPTPVTTTVAFRATNQGGDFECLALAPPSPSGSAGSGIFSVNAMYVTGKVTSLEVNGNTATLRGTATVTGLGAGTDLPFQAQVVGGGPGTSIVLQVSGLTFHEILIDGHLTVR